MNKKYILSKGKSFPLMIIPKTFKKNLLILSSLRLKNAVKFVIKLTSCYHNLIKSPKSQSGPEWFLLNPAQTSQLRQNKTRKKTILHFLSKVVNKMSNFVIVPIKKLKTSILMVKCPREARIS
jgi:hypothetical protein